MKSPLIILIITSFIVTSIVNPAVGALREAPLNLPMPGTMVHLSPAFNPPILKGIKVHPDNPFRFDFVLDQGSNTSADPSAGALAKVEASAKEDYLKSESTKLIKYFLASLTVPEKDLWVNLSPYEKDRIIPEAFGQTEMGRDLLAQDYLLKQITAGLMYPEDELGQKFWKRIYEQAQKKFGTTNIPVNTFNKVWIVPEKAIVYESAKAGTAYVVESKLKVMLEEDYLSGKKNNVETQNLASLSKQIIQEIIIPALTKEVNEGKNFAPLRQVYQSLILADWYKKKIKGSILNTIYSDTNKIEGVNTDDPAQKQKIYERYLQAFKKGVYNYIKEDFDQGTQQLIPRKYFSGGVVLEVKADNHDLAQLSKDYPDLFNQISLSLTVDARPQNSALINVDNAMLNEVNGLESFNKLFNFKVGSDLTDKDRFINEQTAMIQSLFLNKKIYSTNHPASKFLTSLLSKIVKDRPAQVFIINDDYLDAFATPTGSIFVSKKLAKEIMKSEEAALALLMHELNHIEKEHAYNKREKEGGLGYTRGMEVDSDIAEMFRLDERGLNPVGALQMHENLRKYQDRALQELLKKEKDPEKRKFKEHTHDLDITHGTAQQRSMNLREMIRFFDFKNLKDVEHLIDWNSYQIDDFSFGEKSLSDEVQYQGLDYWVWLSKKNLPPVQLVAKISKYLSTLGLEIPQPQRMLAIRIIQDLILREEESIKSGIYSFKDIIFLLDANVFENAGILLSSEDLLIMIQKAVENEIKAKEFNLTSFATNINNFRSALLHWHSLRYSNSSDFELYINNIWISDFIIKQSVKGKFQGSEQVNLKKDIIINIEKRVPFELKDLVNDMQYLVEQTGTERFDMKKVIHRVYHSLGFKYIMMSESDIFGMGGIFIDPDSRLFQNELQKKMKSLMDGVLTSVNKVHDKRGANDLENLVFYTDLLNVYSFDLIYRKENKKYTAQVAEELVEEDTANEDVLNEADTGVIDITHQVFLSSFVSKIEKEYKRVLAKFENISQNDLVALIKGVKNYDAVKLNQFFEKMYHNRLYNLSIYLGGTKTSMQALKSLTILNLLNSRNKKVFLQRVNESIKSLSSSQFKENLLEGFFIWLKELTVNLPFVEPSLKMNDDDIRAFTSMQSTFKQHILSQLAIKKDARGLYADAIKYVNKYKLAFVNINSQKFEEKWSGISKIAIDHLNNSPDFPSTLNEYEGMMALALLSQGSLSTIGVVSTCFREIIRNSPDFETAFAYLRKYNFLPRTLLQEGIDILFESRARTHPQLEELRVWLKGEVDTFLESGDKIIKAEVVENLFRLIGVDERIDFVKGALSTNNNDEAFKKYMAKKWWRIFNSKLVNHFVESGEVDEDGYQPDKVISVSNLEDVLFFAYYGELKNDSTRLQQAALEVRKMASQVAGIDSPYFEELYPSLFRFDSMTVYLLLRSILVEGKDALFLSKKNKVALVEHVIDHYLKFNRSAESDKTVASLTAVISEDLDPQDLFYFLGPSLTSMSLQVPTTSFDTEKIVDYLFETQLADLKSKGSLNKYPNIEDGNKFPKTHAFLKQRIRSYVTGSMVRLSYDKTKEPHGSVFNTFENAALARLEPLIKSRKTFSGEVTPIELSVEAAKNVGGLAVRLLQLAGMYFDLSLEDREQLMQVYDGVRGQNKLQAYMVLKREAEENQKFKPLFDGIKEIGEMLGGGSIVTVYPVLDDNGKEWAVGVKNPNVEYRSEELLKFSHQILDGLLKREPENQTYKLLRILVDDAHAWTLAEIHDEGYNEKNARYAFDNDFRSTNPNKFQPAGGLSQKIFVPEIRDTNTDWVRWEQLIQGESLNKLLIDFQKAKQGKNPEDAQRLRKVVQENVSLIAQNFVFQLLDTGDVHSDIHPGQYFSMTEQRTGVLDRKNILVFDADERALLRNVLLGSVMGNGKQAADRLLKHFIKNVDQTELDNLKERLLKGFNPKAPEKIIDTLLGDLRQQGIIIPLKWVLAVKNIMSLNRKSQLADLDNLFGSLAYDATTGNHEVSVAKMLKVMKTIAPKTTGQVGVSGLASSWLKGKLGNILGANEAMMTVVSNNIASAVGHGVGLKGFNAKPSNLGGIDFNLDKMDLEVQKNGGEIEFHIDPAMLQQLQNTTGFSPVIINIQPINNLRLFLGISETKPLSTTS